MVLIFLGIAGLQGQFVRKSAKLSTQQKEGGEKLEAVKLVGCLMHPFSSGLRARPWIILKQFCSPICPFSDISHMHPFSSGLACVSLNDIEAILPT